jgi:hypothetical protein
MSTEYIGNPHDFDFFAGRWHVANRCLRRRLAGCDEWEAFDGVSEAWVHLDGQVSVDEIAFEGRPWKGCTVRTLDVKARQWEIYWINSKDGRLTPPVRGGWAGDRGEFFGDDLDDGRPVRVRFLWERLGADAARWSQDFALIDPAGGPDGAWECNWVMEFRRLGNR